LGDCGCKLGFFGDDAWEILVIDELFAPEFDLEDFRKKIVFIKK
jgi:hypothetical protein